MDLPQLQQKVAALEKKVQKLEDIEAIKKLQRAYGYYLSTGWARILSIVLPMTPM